MIRWKEFALSTFTHLARYDSFVAERLRDAGRKRVKVAEIIDLGSGVAAPFTIAALPGAERIHIYAIEPDPDLLAVASDIKKGKAVPWSTIAERSVNIDAKTKQPSPNGDFAGQRLRDGLGRLELLGSRQNLGPNFNLEQMQVPAKIADRVTFVPKDAQVALREITQTDFVIAMFLTTNLNKSPDGRKYAEQMLQMISERLTPNGQLLLGDTSRNFPVTLEQIHGTTLENEVYSLTHATQFSPALFIASYFMALRPGGAQPITQRTPESVRVNIARAGITFQESEVDRDSASVLPDESLALAFLAHQPISYGGTRWTTGQGTLAKLCPTARSEWSEEIAAPAQKPELANF